MKEAFADHGHISAFSLYYLTLKRLFIFTSLHIMYEHLTWNTHYNSTFKIIFHTNKTHSCIVVFLLLFFDNTRYIKSCKRRNCVLNRRNYHTPPRRWDICQFETVTVKQI